MLDNETKRRIDEARDILVGKLPDPKSQVEQITIALIYKFMYDMDKEALDFGGKATFFTGEWEKYNWINIFDPKIGGHEMLNLYGEAIVKLNLNPNIPQLFRDIFKNAYLPYRDPETLKLFLKTINGFTYDHSERLGDAFEYLLSVLGSQGDAGQFRTPRHIIDFIVAVLQPRKNETICDPACGTAGFLISSYKYIVAQNTKKHKGDLLTPDDKKKMMQRFTGYDISPDMVRLSLVNMYLHNFTSPRISEYDTLTSEDKWNESFDIIMANPPFMSPKGGIKPHKKFTMQANRSEVLFVDYIAEHINPATGRAGIIVPEGIIFQSANAYKQLRQLLVDKKFLYAVVSLPAGIFQPYSGVKTSILLMDRTLAKKTDNILFVKIENDGFDLGAQRRAIDKNDLTAGLIHLQEYKEAVLNNTEFTSNNKNVFIVDKKVIKGTGDYNLSVDRYRVNENVNDSNWQMVRLGEVCELMTGGTPTSSKKEYYENGTISWLVSGDINKGIIYECEGKITEEGLNNSNAKYLPINSVLMALNGQGKTRASVALLKIKATCNQSLVSINPKNSKQLLSEFLYYYLKSKYQEIRNLTGENERSGLNMPIIRNLKIPLPPLSIQQQIVDKIQSYQAIINGAKQVVQNYKPQIDIDPDWEMVELGDVSEVKDGTHDSPQYFNNGIPFLTQKNITEDGLSFFDIKYIAESDHDKFYKRSNVYYGDILISMIGANRGMSCIVDDDRTFSIKNVGLIKKSNKINQSYLLYFLKSETALNYIFLMSKGGAQEFIGLSSLRKFPLPLPSLSIQQQIVNRIEQEQQLVNANKELIKIHEQKIKDEINKLWQPAAKEYVVEEEKLLAVAEPEYHLKK